MSKRNEREKSNQDTVDPYSKYAEDSVEYVSRQDEIEVLHELGLDLEYMDLQWQ